MEAVDVGELVGVMRQHRLGDFAAEKLMGLPHVADVLLRTRQQGLFRDGGVIAGARVGRRARLNLNHVVFLGVRALYHARFSAASSRATRASTPASVISTFSINMP